MERKQNADFFENVLLDNYWKDPADRLQQRNIVNLKVPPEISVMPASPIIVRTYKFLGT